MDPVLDEASRIIRYLNPIVKATDCVTSVLFETYSRPHRMEWMKADPLDLDSPWQGNHTRNPTPKWRRATRFCFRASMGGDGPFPLQSLHGDVIVGVDADACGGLERFADDALGVEIRVLDKGSRGRQGEAAA